MCIPSLTQFTHLKMATYSLIIHHVTKQNSAQSDLMNMTMNSMYREFYRELRLFREPRDTLPFISIANMHRYNVLT